MVKSIGCTCGGHRFSFQHLYGELPPSLTLVPWVPLLSPSLPVFWADTWFTCIHLDKTSYTSLMSGIKDRRHLDWMYLLACFGFWCTAFYKKNCLAELLSLFVPLCNISILFWFFCETGSSWPRMLFVDQASLKSTCLWVRSAGIQAVSYYIYLALFSFLDNEHVFLIY